VIVYSKSNASACVFVVGSKYNIIHVLRYLFVSHPYHLTQRVFNPTAMSIWPAVMLTDVKPMSINQFLMMFSCDCGIVQLNCNFNCQIKKQGCVEVLWKLISWTSITIGYSQLNYD